jgi:TolB protein
MDVQLLFDSEKKISYLCLNNRGDQLAFSMKADGDADEDEEIFVVSADGDNLHRLTNNNWWDLYPVWSPDDSRIAFLTWRGGSLGIYVMDADGSNEVELFDSSSHEADIDWVGDTIAFTKDSRIWMMRSDGSEAQAVSNPPRAGEWGSANLPFGDYDPRISPDGSKIVFERLIDDESPYGNYDLYIMDARSGNEKRLTTTGNSQGLAAWSHSGEKIVYIVSAIGQNGQYDIYMMNADGTDNRRITPDYFPDRFLCHWAVFAKDDSAVYFIGEWWAAEQDETGQMPVRPVVRNFESLGCGEYPCNTQFE